MRAMHTFVVGTKTGDRVVLGGSVLDENDPVVKGQRDFFEPVPEDPPVVRPPLMRRRPSNG
jgi:hypothetical protein